jgi:hypothetical protein
MRHRIFDTRRRCSQATRALFKTDDANEVETVSRKEDSTPELPTRPRSLQQRGAFSGILSGWAGAEYGKTLFEDFLRSQFRCFYRRFQHWRDLYDSLHFRPGSPQAPAIGKRRVAHFRKSDMCRDRSGERKVTDSSSDLLGTGCYLSVYYWVS